MRRRTFLLALGGGALARAAPASANFDVGVSIARELFQAIETLDGVTEGAGLGTMHVLYAPWCHTMPQLWADTRSFMASVKIKWVPYSGNQPEGKFGTEMLLRSHDPASIPRSFTKIHSNLPAVPTPLADAQDLALGRMMTLVYRETSKSLVTPTIFYQRGNGRARIVRGAPDRETIAQIAMLAK